MIQKLLLHGGQSEYQLAVQSRVECAGYSISPVDGCASTAEGADHPSGAARHQEETIERLPLASALLTEHADKKAMHNDATVTGDEEPAGQDVGACGGQQCVEGAPVQANSRVVGISDTPITEACQLDSR